MSLQHVEIEIQQQVASLDEYISGRPPCNVLRQEETDSWVDPPQTASKRNFVPVCIRQLVRDTMPYEFLSDDGADPEIEGVKFDTSFTRLPIPYPLLHISLSSLLLPLAL